MKQSDVHGMSLATIALQGAISWRDKLLADREAREVKQAIADAKTYRVPALERGCFEYEWNTDCVVPVICHLSYEPADGDNWNTPYYPESVTLGAAYLRGVDIFEMLSPEQIDRIEEQALIEHAEDAREAAAEASYDSWQERRNG